MDKRFGNDRVVPLGATAQRPRLSVVETPRGSNCVVAVEVVDAAEIAFETAWEAAPAVEPAALPRPAGFGFVPRTGKALSGPRRKVDAAPADPASQDEPEEQVG